MHHEDEVRSIAYRIWEGEGGPDGRHLEHWLKAEAIWQQEQNHQTVGTPEDPLTRTDLVTPRVAAEPRRSHKHPRRASR